MEQNNQNQNQIQEHNPYVISNSLINNQQQPQINNNSPLKKKNRTLQFYKFLFYSMKSQTHLHSFHKMIHSSNVSEIIIWFISFILYFCTPKCIIDPIKCEIKYQNFFIWIHIIHVIRAILGIFIWYKLPKSYQIVDALNKLPDNTLETKLFNDLIRETINMNMLKGFHEKRIILLSYLLLSFINFIFDILDFLIVLPKIYSAVENYVIILLTDFLISLLYISKDYYFTYITYSLVIDLSFFFWGGFLKYVMPPTYYHSISSVFFGMIPKALARFKIGKKETDIQKEAEIQGQSQSHVQQEYSGKLPELNQKIDGENMNNADVNEVHIDF